MRPTRTLSWTALAALLLVAVAPPSAHAATSVSGEVSGNSAAARTAVDALRTSWVTDVAAGGYTAPSPMVLSTPAGSAVTGVIGTTAVGTTVSVERTRYSASATAPVFVSASPNPGTAACTNSGLSMQGSAPRPASLNGNPACANGSGTVYTESGGIGESTTRDGVSFTFSRPVWAFGAWFGDVETRTDGLGVPAIVRLLDDNGVLVDEFVVEPVGATQSLCSNLSAGCGNNSTRWVGFTGVLASSMVVIVGDEDALGTALDEGMGFVGANPVDATPRLALAIGTAALGPVTAGTVIGVPLSVTNPGEVMVSSLAGANCGTSTIAAGATQPCTVQHTVTQPELDAGGFDLTVTVQGDWTGLTAAATDTRRVPLVRATTFSVALAADIADFDTVGTPITYTATVTNTGNQAHQPDSVTIDGVSLTCSPTGAVPPGATIGCIGTLVTTSGADVVRTAAVAWGASSADSNPVTITWVARRGFTVGLAADIADFDTVGTPITYTATVTNTGNQAHQPDSVTIDGVSLTCSPTGAVPPGRRSAASARWSPPAARTWSAPPPWIGVPAQPTAARSPSPGWRRRA